MSRIFVDIPINQDRLILCFNEAHLVDMLLLGDGSMDRGAIHMAKVDRAVKGLGGVFVKLGKETAFLRSKTPPAPGKMLPVQIIQPASDDKPARVSDMIDYRGAHIVLTPGRKGVNQSRKTPKREGFDALKEKLAAKLPDDCGLILRSHAAKANQADIIAELEILLARLENVKKAKEAGLIIPADIGMARALIEWGEGVYEQQEALNDAQFEAARRALTLPLNCAGGKVMIERMQALIAVDIDTGANTAPSAGRDVNMAAIPRIASWLRLMGWGGQLLIDPAPMPMQARKGFETSLVSAAKKSKLGLIPRGFGPLGLFETQIRYERRVLPKNILTFLEGN